MADRRAADAEVVRRLRAAGAIMIGKTNMPELAIFPFTESAAYGATRNPWDTARTPGGSSGGSAAAVAAGLVGVASASDGGGSIRIPGRGCGLFGLKPQRGRVPLAPQPDHWHGLTAAGAVSRSVLDTALFLDVVSDRGGYGGQSQREPRPAADRALLAALDARTRRPPRARRGRRDLAELLRTLGHSVEEHDPDYGVMAPVFLPRWFRGIHDDATRMAHPRRLERRTRAIARIGSLFTLGSVARARRESRTARRSPSTASSSASTCCLLRHCPRRPIPSAASRAARWLATTLGSTLRVPFTTPWNVTGQPAASVPTPAMADGVPLAAQLVAPPDGEETLISLAAQLGARDRLARAAPAGRLA